MPIRALSDSIELVLVILNSLCYEIRLKFEEFGNVASEREVREKHTNYNSHLQSCSLFKHG